MSIKYYNNDWIYDIETYKNLFTFTAISSDGKQGVVFELSDRKNNIPELKKFIKMVNDTDGRLVGFNNLSFDYPVIHYILKTKKIDNEKIFNKAQELIDSMKGGGFGKTLHQRFHLVKQVDLFKIHHFDNKARSTSLKILKFNMKVDNLQDLPYDINEELTHEQMDNVIIYNIDDVLATLKFYYESYGALELRVVMGDKYDADFTNMNDGKIGTEIFIKEIEKVKPNSCYKQENGRKVICQTQRSSIALKDVILPYIKFDRPEFQAILDWFKAQTIQETNGVFSDILESDLGEVAKYATLVTKKSAKMNEEPTQEELEEFRKEIPLAEVMVKELKSGKKSYYYTWNVAESLHVNINGHSYVFGVGGIHSSIDSKLVESDKDNVICDLDVVSYYPNLAIKNTVYPEHLGETFCTIYEKMFNERKKYAKGTPENLAIKLLLNSIYGVSNSKYSPFYDPQYTMTITINGQLSLCMLLEKILEIEGAYSIQSNTDGITMMIPRKADDKVTQLVKEWEEVTKLEMERNDYSKMFVRDVNNYVSVYDKSDEVKLKGAYVADLEHHKDQSAIIVQKAAVAFMVDGKDIRQYITEHDNKYDFMLRTKIPRSFKLVTVDDIGKEVSEQRVTRYYVSKADDAKSMIKKMPPAKGKEDDRTTGICVGRKVKVCNDITLFNKEDVDIDYYVEEALKLVDCFTEKESA